MNNHLELIKTRLENSGIEIKYQEPMSRHTTFRIGGSAALYLIPKTNGELAEIMSALRTADLPYFILGNGSNVIFPDEGYHGAVISTEALAEIKIEGTRLTCGVGVSLTLAAKTARDHGLTGMEFAHGIPGSCGGAVYMNAGAYGGEISGILAESTYLDRDGLHTIPVEAHEFGYRSSIYKKTTGKIITQAVFQLSEGDRDAITNQMNDLMNRRVSKQPLEYPSAGSVFKRYPGQFTGQMIEEAGLKGYTIGGAQISEKHAGFIINRGGATAADVENLVAHIKAVILERTGCTLECEIIFVK